MEPYILISFLNDFIFCPRSIYFHQLYGNRHQLTYHEKAQVEGKESHKSIDNQDYSTKKNILQGMSVYSEKYNLCGKIDIYDGQEGVLIERKKMIKTVYDGYVFQLYAQYHCLIEMGYRVKKLFLYSMDTNKRYPVISPDKDRPMQDRFEKIIEDIKSYNLKQDFLANPKKCAKCIYAHLCDKKAELC